MGFTGFPSGGFTIKDGNNVLWHCDRKFFVVGKRIGAQFLADLKVPDNRRVTGTGGTGERLPLTDATGPGTGGAGAGWPARR